MAWFGRVVLLVPLVGFVACDAENMESEQGETEMAGSDSGTDSEPSTETEGMCINVDDCPVPACSSELGPIEDPIPAACAGLEVPTPAAELRELSATLASDATILASTHEAYRCSADYTLDDLECPCVGQLILDRLEFSSPTFEVGETTASLSAANASLSDTCDIQYEHEFSTSVEDVPVQILAVSEDCIIGEVASFSMTRFYADRTACN